MMSFYIAYYRSGLFGQDDLDLFLSVGMMSRADYDLAKTYKDEADANRKIYLASEQAKLYPSN